MPTRALFHLRMPDDNTGWADYAVDIPRKRKRDPGTGRAMIAHVYLGGTHVAQSKLPARFPVHGGTIEVATSRYGLKRCHYVEIGGRELQLTPDPRSAEGKRSHFGREHPGLSRMIGMLSMTLLIIGVILLIFQLVGPLSAIPLVAEKIGTIESPVHLPWWLNFALGLGAAAGALERGLRLRHSWLDSAGT
ncbi:hypothetical protein ABLG96_08025 [Nakamurella sp. A5-74]|uniref:Uncharacterized protein n=1 Tax=Nakamurella sp. A5-74 TaxID=3158264 RepID=A0AAU8DV14_9ACTN